MTPHAPSLLFLLVTLAATIIMTASSTAPTNQFPDLPLVCLETAQDLTTTSVLRGKNTVIDFWTTRCTRCPAALDKLDALKASDERFQNVNFVSICCDKLDGAREIIEKDDALKWQHVNHYYMAPDDKEVAKAVFGFKSVPFYVVVNEEGEITDSGNHVDMEAVPGMVPDQENVILRPAVVAVETKQVDAAPVQEEPVFVLDDLDF